MNRLASLLPEYEVVMQMEGTGPITGPALMAEIGDVRRFKNKKALVAFAGIDAPPFQSGNFESKSRHVSKRGSPHLRRAVFLVANIILTLSHKDNSVFCFMDKSALKESTTTSTRLLAVRNFCESTTHGSLNICAPKRYLLLPAV